MNKGSVWLPLGRLLPAARAKALKRHGEQVVLIHPFGYEPPTSEVLGYPHKLFYLGDLGLLHDLRPRDVHPWLASGVRDSRLENLKSLLFFWQRCSGGFAHEPKNTRYNLSRVVVGLRLLSPSERHRDVSSV